MIVEKLDHYGRGIVRDNKICFVENALPGEDIELDSIIEYKKYSEAKVSKYISRSKERVKPLCKYYDICGGCHLEHLKYIKQLEFKKDKVKEIIKRFADINIEINDILYSNDYYYRNKVVLHVKNGKLGFYKNKSNELIEIDKCLLLDEKVNNLIKVLRENINLDRVEKITIKIGNITNEVMLIIDGVIDDYYKLFDVVNVLVINKKLVTKRDYISSIIGDKTYRIGVNSFFQVNKYVTVMMYDEIKSIIKSLGADNVLDLYCGTGTIGIYVADLVKSVLGIEVVSDAVSAANINKDINGVSNISFIKGKAEKEIYNIDKDYDTYIVDPPRSGLHKNIVELIKKKLPKSIIYVSCDPTTLARDINLLKDKYDVSSIKLFDMFPNTYHVECVCLLERKNS